MVFTFLSIVKIYCSLSQLVYFQQNFTLLAATLWPIKRIAIFAKATSEKDAYSGSFAKQTSMSHVAGFRAANFITIGSPGYNASSRILQKGPTPPTDQQAPPP